MQKTEFSIYWLCHNICLEELRGSSTSAEWYIHIAELCKLSIHSYLWPFWDTRGLECLCKVHTRAHTCTHTCNAHMHPGRTQTKHWGFVSLNGGQVLAHFLWDTPAACLADTWISAPALRGDTSYGCHSSYTVCVTLLWQPWETIRINAWENQPHFLLPQPAFEAERGG